MFLIYAGESYDIEKEKNVELFGFKIDLIQNKKGLAVSKYYIDKDDDSKFYKVVEYKFEDDTDRWYRRIFQLTKEEFKEEVKDIPKENKIY